MAKKKEELKEVFREDGQDTVKIQLLPDVFTQNQEGEYQNHYGIEGQLEKVGDNELRLVATVDRDLAEAFVQNGRAKLA